MKKRGRGRPPLPAGKARDVKLTVRMTRDEYIKVLATRPPGTTMASIIRSGLFDGTIIDVTKQGEHHE
jgi:hypothetical protein